jgi:hypothetical protein
MLYYRPQNRARKQRAFVRNTQLNAPQIPLKPRPGKPLCNKPGATVRVASPLPRPLVVWVCQQAGTGRHGLRSGPTFAGPAGGHAGPRPGEGTPGGRDDERRRKRAAATRESGPCPLRIRSVESPGNRVKGVSALRPAGAQTLRHPARGCRRRRVRPCMALEGVMAPSRSLAMLLSCASGAPPSTPATT